MHQKFAALGDMQGKTSEDIIAVMGGPSAVVRRAEGNVLMEWSGGGSRVRLHFDDQRRFVQVAHACIRNVALAPEMTTIADPDADTANHSTKFFGIVVGSIMVVMLVVGTLTILK